ncbi:MAG: GntR family transcriptional regulator [Lachnospiraceae bacterium]|nr:GntR family transcriptional regulator [Lachnospiraceae bacterium]
MAQSNGRAKYYIVMESLRKDMNSGKIKPGDKIPSENELSASFSVSRHTVRKALSILENEGLLEATHGLGTFCTERHRNSKSSKNIAVVTTYISDYIFPRLIQGMDNVLTENGYSIILKNTGNSQKNEAKALEDILTKNVDGIIIEPSKSEIYCRHTHLYELFDKLQIPYIFIQGTYPQMKDRANIIMDDVQGGYLLTKYLLELGHRKIVGIFKIDDSQGTARHKGYIKALTENGVSYDPDLVITFHTEDRAKKPAAMIEQFVKEHRQMDAIVCYNDQIAMEVIQVLKAYDIRVPEDISITGYDNSLISESGYVKLTTVSHPKEKLGEMAAELLLEKINHIPDAESRVPRIVEPELVVRDSCAAKKTTCREMHTSPILFL